jgi:type II pantothenate kinase
MIIGIDLGGSSTKAVALQGDKVVGNEVIPTTDPLASSIGVMGTIITKLGKSLSDIEVLALCGARSTVLPSRILGSEVRKVDEIHAIGLGGAFLSHKEDALVVSMGTGTAVVVARKGGTIVEHLCGTGVGGGSVIGLSRRLLNTSDIQLIESMAKKGDLTRVNLRVQDVAGGPVGNLVPEATASNFGGLKDDATGPDLAAGIFNMVGEVIGMLAVVSAKATGLQDHVVLVGRLAKIDLLVRHIMRVGQLFNVKMVVPDLAEYCVAVGAAKFCSATR